jgi:hypothetical protein
MVFVVAARVISCFLSAACLMRVEVLGEAGLATEIRNR